jgi:hypothetical protein
MRRTGPAVYDRLLDLYRKAADDQADLGDLIMAQARSGDERCERRSAVADPNHPVGDRRR